MNHRIQRELEQSSQEELVGLVKYLQSEVQRLQGLVEKHLGLPPAIPRHTNPTQVQIAQAFVDVFQNNDGDSAVLRLRHFIDMVQTCNMSAEYLKDLENLCDDVDQAILRHGTVEA